jgi:hypothetical protein
MLDAAPLCNNSCGLLVTVRPSISVQFFSLFVIAACSLIGDELKYSKLQSWEKPSCSDVGLSSNTLHTSEIDCWR